MKKALLWIGAAAIALVATSCSFTQKADIHTPDGVWSYKVPASLKWDTTDKKYVSENGNMVVDSYYYDDANIAEKIDSYYDNVVTATGEGYVFTLIKESTADVHGLKTIYRLYSIAEEGSEPYQYWGLIFYDAGFEQYNLDIDMPYKAKNIKVIDQIVASMKATQE